MKLQCKLCKEQVEVTEPIKGAIDMVKHIQKKHPLKAMEAISMIAAYAATHCYTPVIPPEELADANKESPTMLTFLDSRKTLLKGFKEYADTLGVKA